MSLRAKSQKLPAIKVRTLRAGKLVPKATRKIDKVRASRDGHEFHEAWTARKAMQLLLSEDGLVAIAVEGLEPSDQATASSATVEIADLVLYYGQHAEFQRADRVAILQFKYTIARTLEPLRAADAKETVRKFAAVYREHRANHGAKNVSKKLTFELITNRPVLRALDQAIVGIAGGRRLVGIVAEQAKQFRDASGLKGEELAEFASKLVLTGSAGNLSDTKRETSRTLVAWSGASDPLARARLGNLRQMVRDKAGDTGAGRNLITKTDLLAALELSEIEELLPCPAALPAAGPVVEREQLAAAIELVPRLDKPLVIHAAGGVGKTVFMESLAGALADKHEVMFFDCFGGGAYRAPQDTRHHPKRGMIHIANSLACRGLCDPLLPSDDVESLLRAFLRRLSQCLGTLKQASSGRQLLLFIDAVDNAAQQAADRGEAAFPTLLLESLEHEEIAGLKVIVSCRSHRKAIAMKETECAELELRPFSPTETTAFLGARVTNVTQTEIQVAQSRSGGNGRILEHLATSDRGLLDPSEIAKTITLDDLLSRRIETALTDARRHGHTAENTNAFLAGLAVLPPPVPVEEYANAHGLEVSAVESFAADLAPLLERTKHGLTFRDEPTETLIRERYAANRGALQSVATNLFAHQGMSVYAARALPQLLQMLGDGARLFELAFDTRFPAAISSTVGQRGIRYSRLKAALGYAADKSDYDQLVHLLVELSTVTASDSRGADYILNYPDLVIAGGDVDAHRRLFETRTRWPGARHARMAIAETLSGSFDDAHRHARSAFDWLRHDAQQRQEVDPNRGRPEPLDVAAIPFCLAAQDRPADAIDFLRGWREWYAFRVGENLIGLLRQAEPVMCGGALAGLLASLKGDVGCIAAALSHLELERKQSAALVGKLARALRKKVDLSRSDVFDRQTGLADGLLKASAIAISLGRRSDATAILRRTPKERPSVWSFSDPFSSQYVLPFILRVALDAAARGTSIGAREILPKELVPLARGLGTRHNDAEFVKRLQARLAGKRKGGKDLQPVMDYDRRRDAERFLGEKFKPLLSQTRALAEVLECRNGKADGAFCALVEAWSAARGLGERYGTQRFNRCFESLGCDASLFALWARSDLAAQSVKAFLTCLHEQEILATQTRIRVVRILAARQPLQSLVGAEAATARSAIETESEVSYRASLCADLARAILPASRDEATAYFKQGLEQMDAIGSGDYDLTNELLVFASELKGDVLADPAMHTLTNICELNIPGDSEKFPWSAFARGLSRAAGAKVLAKLARWDDRGKVGLDYTLLPYLTSLVRDEKIPPECAVALNRLAEPAEWWSCGTSDFVRALDDGKSSERQAPIRDAIKQFEEDHPGIPSAETVKALAGIAERVLGKGDEVTGHLRKAHDVLERVRNELNENSNYRGQDNRALRVRRGSDRSDERKLDRIAARINPSDEHSLSTAINQLDAIGGVHSNPLRLFEKLRQRVPFRSRSEYLRVLARLENLDFHAKLAELDSCRRGWGSSSAALAATLREIEPILVSKHVEDLVSFGSVSVAQLKELSSLSSIPIPEIAIDVIKAFAPPDQSVDASVWLGLASLILARAREGEGQKALARMLASDAAQLSSTVEDGPWGADLYPSDDPVEVASGLVWRTLGSPKAAERWLAAHSVRSMARLGRWDIVGALVARIKSSDAGPFQARELPFFYMHARVWLLIALARAALDYPKQIGSYQKELLRIVRDEAVPHVLMRGFAAQALIACHERGGATLSPSEEKEMRAINRSPFPVSHEAKRGSGFYQGRPEDAPSPRFEFHLDYDFDKSEVHGLSDVFGKRGWEVKDQLAEVVARFDPAVKSMYESDGRERPYRDGLRGMTSSYHSHGQQLAWHGLLVVAGSLLRQYPVVHDPYWDERWRDWLGRNLLTRDDGLWLSDGLDRSPLDIKVNLLEQDKDSLAVTGSKSKILGLAGIARGIGKELVVCGGWQSPDGINVHIRSVLVPSRDAKALAARLIEEEPTHVWLPAYEDGDSEYLRHERGDCVPWIVCPSPESRLDRDDPLGARFATRRPRFAESIMSEFSLRTDDPFGRIWRNAKGAVVARAEAWGPEEPERNRGAGGVRLLCSKQLLSSTLTKRDCDLVQLITLGRYQEKFGSDGRSKYTHTVAVVRVKKTLSMDYIRGRINHIWAPTH